MTEAVSFKPSAKDNIEALRPPIPVRSRRERLRMPLMVGVPLLIGIVAAVYFLTGGRFQSTDDAYVKFARAGISSGISGRVVEVAVRENQSVKMGDVLLRLDRGDYQIAVARAEAILAGARFEAEGLLATYHQRLADKAAADEAVAFTAREAKRQKDLAAAGVSSKGQADEAQHAAEQAVARQRVAEQHVLMALAAIGGDATRPVDEFPNVMKAKAELDQAKSDLANTTLTAPSDGTVTKVDQIAVGTRVMPAQILFWLVSGRPWIEANFKEDQIANMRVGQPAEISVDACDTSFSGHVASFSPGTGSSFSILPPENASGNWVKVVQRLSVQIAIDGDIPCPLSAGLSSTATVDTAAAGSAPAAP